MNEAVKIVRKNNYAVCVYPDFYPESPREWDNLGKLFIKTRSVYNTECTEEDVKKAPVRLQVYKYEHSGIALSTSNASYPFNDPWDSCLAGYIIAKREDILKEFNAKRLTAKLKDKVVEILKNEIEIYSQYIDGEVYGFKVFSGIDDGVPDEEIEEVGTEEDSCWGFYSVQDALEEGLECVPETVTA